MTIHVITKAEHVTDKMLDTVEECVHDRFPPGIALTTEEFIDRLCDYYAEGWDVENYDTPAVRKIVRHAHNTRREMT